MVSWKTVIGRNFPKISSICGFYRSIFSWMKPKVGRILEAKVGRDAKEKIKTRVWLFKTKAKQKFVSYFPLFFLKICYKANIFLGIFSSLIYSFSCENSLTGLEKGKPWGNNSNIKYNLQSLRAYTNIAWIQICWKTTNNNTIWGKYCH